MRGMTRKWRPSLALVLSGALAFTLVFSLIGLIALRLLGPEIGFRNAGQLIALVILGLTSGLGALLIRFLIGPIRALARYASDMRRGHVGPLPQHFGTRELHALAGSVVEMAEALRLREATIRSYSDHVTHELKSPVSAMVAAAELLQDRPLDGADRALVDQVAGAAAEMNRQLDALRRVARAREADYRGEARPSEVLPDLDRKYPGLSVDIAGDAPVPLTAEGLGLVLDQLLSNAASHGATSVRVEAAPGRLVVADNGSGIPPGNRDRIFQPFFTTRREGGGTGMGLAIVQSVLAAHRAEIAVADTPDANGGAAFEITFAD
ncbi:HAMP domain-containing protein [Rhodobacterales bacterium HKCCE2091]|nr:HAMP domain-containing protein [Rhodobacterales bacterium HKCCE2091]